MKHKDSILWNTSLDIFHKFRKQSITIRYSRECTTLLERDIIPVLIRKTTLHRITIIDSPYSLCINLTVLIVGNVSTEIPNMSFDRTPAFIDIADYDCQTLGFCQPVQMILDSII